MSKGSGRRENSDDKAYAENWDRIFGKKKCVEPFCNCEPGKCKYEEKPVEDKNETDNNR